MKFYDKDPNDGGKEVPFWDYFTKSGQYNYFRERGITINPVHSFELLKKVRFEQYQIHKQKFIEERNFNRLNTLDSDLNLFYGIWLNNELEVVERWLSATHPNGEKKKVKESISNQIEISKYKQFVLNELERMEEVIRQPLPDWHSQINQIKQIGTISQEGFDETIDVLRRSIASFYKPISDRNAIFGIDLCLINIFSILIKPYCQIYSNGGNLTKSKEQRIYVKMLQARHELKYQLNEIRSQALYLKNNKVINELDIYVQFIEQSFAFLRESCSDLGSYRFYDNNFHKPEIDTWLKCFEIDFNLEKYQLKNGNEIEQKTNYFSTKFTVDDLSPVEKITRPKSEKNVKSKLRLKSNIIKTVFEILKEYFDPKNHIELKRILETGDSVKTKLLFLDNGNKLADVFKKLFEANYIVDCQKKELEVWIIDNFEYKYNREVKSFTRDYAEKCISRQQTPCANPIIVMGENGEIKTEHSRIKKMND